MNLDLEAQLERLADEAEAPSSVSASSIERRARAAHNRMTMRVLGAVALVVALVVALGWALRPHSSPAPTPTPSPSPSDEGWWLREFELTWPADGLEVPEEIAAERCQLKSTETFAPSDSLAAGRVARVFDDPQSLPTPIERVDPSTGETMVDEQVDEAHVRYCHLGYRDPVADEPIARTDLDDPRADFKALCSKHSGYPFGDNWRVATTHRDQVQVDPPEVVALVSDAQTLAICTLDAGGPAADLYFPHSVATLDSCFESINGYADNIDARNPKKQVTTQVSLSGAELLGEDLAEAHEVRISSGGQLLVVQPVVDSVLLVQERVLPTKPLPVKADDPFLRLTFEAVSATGGVLKRCTRG